MPRTLFLCMLVLSLGLTACDQQRDFADSASENKAMSDENFQKSTLVSAQQNPQKISAETNNYALERKVIKKGNISFSSENLDATEVVIKTALSANGGYISEETANEDNYQASRKLVVRIPATQFDIFLKDISDKAGKLESKNITTEDVTTEYLDLTVHIRIKKALEERYYELLQQCKTMDAIIQMEKQLNEVRTDIETAQGRLNYLSGLTSFSTLTITFYAPEAQPVVAKNGFFAKVGKSFASGWNFILNFIIGLVRIWPFFVFIVCGYFIYKKLKSQVRFLKI